MYVSLLSICASLAVWCPLSYTSNYVIIVILKQVVYNILTSPSLAVGAFPVAEIK